MKQVRVEPVFAGSLDRLQHSGGLRLPAFPDRLKAVRGIETAQQRRVHALSGDLQAGIMKTTNPALSNDVDFFPGTRLRWGLGHMINADPVPEGRKAGSLTWAGLYNTYYWIDPASRVAGVIMMQILPFADRAALKVYREFEQRVCRSMQATEPGLGHEHPAFDPQRSRRERVELHGQDRDGFRVGRVRWI